MHFYVLGQAVSPSVISRHACMHTCLVWAGIWVTELACMHACMPIAFLTVGGPPWGDPGSRSLGVILPEMDKLLCPHAHA